MPWQPWPKMHMYCDVSQVRSHLKTCAVVVGIGELDVGAGDHEVGLRHAAHAYVGATRLLRA